MDVDDREQRVASAFVDPGGQAGDRDTEFRAEAGAPDTAGKVWTEPVNEKLRPARPHAGPLPHPLVEAVRPVGSRPRNPTNVWALSDAFESSAGSTSLGTHGRLLPRRTHQGPDALGGGAR